MLRFAFALSLALGLLSPTAPTAPADARDVPVAFIVVARDAATATSAAAALDRAAPALLDDFRAATGGRVALRAVGAATILAAPPGVAALDDVPAALARAHFTASGGSARLLVVVAVDVPVGGPLCACVAWARPAQLATPDGPLDRSALFGAAPGFLGVVALGDADVLQTPDELRFRFLHEVGHAWCCRGLPGASGAHWPPALADARDPLAEAHAREGPWRFSPASLDAMRG